MKLLAAEGLMYDPGLIECAEFDWFSARCLEDAPSFTSRIRRRLRHLSSCPCSQCVLSGSCCSVASE